MDKEVKESGSQKKGLFYRRGVQTFFIGVLALAHIVSVSLFEGLAASYHSSHSQLDMEGFDDWDFEDDFDSFSKYRWYNYKSYENEETRKKL